jgi:nucleoside-diphosphate-sugar epimerase
MKIFVAGATGAVGLPLVRALCTLGHQVIGMTRAGPGVDRLRELGVSPPPLMHLNRKRFAMRVSTDALGRIRSAGHISGPVL